MARLLSILTVAALCALCGCSSDDVVCKCGDFELTVDDLRFEVHSIGPSYDFDGSAESRMKLVEHLTARYVVAEEAVALGLAEGAEDARLNAERMKVAEVYKDWKLDRSIRIPRISTLRWRPKVDRMFYLKDITFRARGLAEDALVLIMAGADYADLEEAYADHDAIVFLDVGWKKWPEMDDSAIKYVVPLEIGEFSDVVNLQDGYHIFYLADASPGETGEKLLFLRARKFEKMAKEETLRRRNQRGLVARYGFEPDPEGVNAAMEAVSTAFSGERPPAELLGKAVATYSGGRVTVADLFTYYYSAPEGSKVYLGDAYGIIRGALDAALHDLHVRAGYDMKLDRMYEVRWAADKAREDYLVPQVEDHFRSGIDITDAEIEQYYEDRRSDLRSARRYRASRILLENEDEVTQVTRGLEAGRDFGALAAEYSHDEYTGARGGDLGTLSYGVIAVYDSIIDGMQVGEVSPPFRTGSGIELLMLQERSGGEQLTFEEAIPYIEMFIRNQRANDMLADLVRQRKEDYGFYVNEDLLADLWLPEPGRGGRHVIEMGR